MVLSKEPERFSLVASSLEEHFDNVVQTETLPPKLADSVPLAEWVLRGKFNMIRLHFLESQQSAIRDKQLGLPETNEVPSELLNL